MDNEDLLSEFFVYQQLIPYILNRSNKLAPQLLFIGVVKPDNDGHFIAVGQLMAGGKFSIVPTEGADPITDEMLVEDLFLVGLQNTPTGVGSFPAIVTSKGVLSLPLPRVQDYLNVCSNFESGIEISQLNKDIEDHIIMIFETEEYLGEPLCVEVFEQIIEFNEILKNKTIKEICEAVEFVDES
jgi:hypothetical protein